MGLWLLALDCAELLLSSAVHMMYGMYIFSAAVASDIDRLMTPSSGRVVGTSNRLRWISPNPPPSDRAKEENADHRSKFPRGPNDVDTNRKPKENLPPIVLVHGIFGFGKGRLGGLSYFAGAETKDEYVLVPDLGSLTSIYDRARELFYYLKGGQVDYGEEHSKICGHCQFGRVYSRGNYEAWDEQHPVHFVGHSAGVQVVRVLQQLLAEKAFKGYEDTSADWVLSVTSLSGALNGTTRTYRDGMQPEDGRWMKRLCLLQLCRVGVILYEWLDIPWLKRYYSFGFDHFRMGWSSLGISGLIDSLLANNGGGPFASGDWILPDLTLQGSMQLNAALNTFPNTFYFSYATKRTTKVMGTTVPSSILGIHPLLFIRVLQMTRWRHPPNVPTPYKGYRDEDWHDNDGAVNTISMTHPRIPVEHPSQFVADDQHHPLRPGIWYYKIVEADHILFIVNRERAGAQFDVIYDSIFERCRKHITRTTICIQ
ncbi:Lipase [Nymphaea thermarum]|nr:Lipase [Nymphaea thermarum]